MRRSFCTSAASFDDRWIHFLPASKPLFCLSFTFCRLLSVLTWIIFHFKTYTFDHLRHCSDSRCLPISRQVTITLLPSLNPPPMLTRLPLREFSQCLTPLFWVWHWLRFWPSLRLAWLFTRSFKFAICSLIDCFCFTRLCQSGARLRFFMAHPWQCALLNLLILHSFAIWSYIVIALTPQRDCFFCYLSQIFLSGLSYLYSWGKFEPYRSHVENITSPFFFSFHFFPFLSFLSFPFLSYSFLSFPSFSLLGQHIFSLFRLLSSLLRLSFLLFHRLLLTKASSFLCLSLSPPFPILISSHSFSSNTVSTHSF